ncbi:flagellar basal-body rod modification protein FlgD [Fontimonas thermophila]|uniref:Basal-body rod modification protein FlgD n=1 Tax=Fontimonas thermophila TaxID=1076937 RepID=A0A1I2JLH7_9GAMM|nr:flagellar hook assembly protein FlgD [Fontimonas thermophila]SFF55434.1 flagellar basal-body rod modification protein FlgD [Fontimonas thermophila]
MPAIDTTYADLGLALAQPAASKKTIGQDEFLLLMTTQLKNQDPFKPMENGEFLGQLAQFSTVAGISEMQTSLQALATALSSSQMLQGASLVGRSVLVPSTTGYLPADGALDGAAYVPASGHVVVDIVDAAGAVVRTLDLGTQPSGWARFSWDGTRVSGERLDAGRYTLQARLVQGATQQSLSTSAVGRVQSVATSDQHGLVLELLGLAPVALADVQQIL